MWNLDGSKELVDITRPVQLDPDILDLMTDEDIYHMILRNVIALEEHEATEWFKVSGKTIVDPHPELKQGSR